MQEGRQIIPKLDEKKEDSRILHLYVTKIWKRVFLVFKGVFLIKLM